MSDYKNNWSGLWRTRDGTLVRIAENPLDNNTVIGRMIGSNIITTWNPITGDHVSNEALDLIIRKRDEDTNFS